MRVPGRVITSALVTLLLLFFFRQLILLPFKQESPPSHKYLTSPTRVHPSLVSSSSILFTQCPPPPVHLAGPFFHPAQSIDPRFLTIAEDKKAPLCRPPTPLFVTFASSCCLLEQAVLSYIAEGWPASQIIVVDNSGTSRENLQGYLTEADHTFLNYTLLLRSYGVSIFRSPVRQSFAQLQNMLLELAQESRWQDYYSSHQDVIVRSSMETKDAPFFLNILQQQRQLRQISEKTRPWAFYFFNYDWLVHVNVHAAQQIGPWDVLIPWYPTDCDYYARTRMKGLSIIDYYAGEFYDVSSCLVNADEMLFLARNSSKDSQLEDVLKNMVVAKTTHKAGRNTWQGRQLGGISDDFGRRFQVSVEAGRRSYRMKWGTAACDPTSHQRSLFRWLESWAVWR